MNVGATELIVILLLLAFLAVPLGLMIWAITDLLRYDDAAWERAAQHKVSWLLIVIIVGFLGPLIYLLSIRPKLEAAAS
ncbi:MAG: hypothetical protein HKN94_07855 [Acidimicrobiales bacterium]|nr:hypothetical protein [Acidimicrobiales bacterium]RZV48391.1 MAG: hypothetical protein EX269_01930 [Acidimicrobiales bacterium]